jgi:branched-chain amino acid transport system substrate-binding protein
MATIAAVSVIAVTLAACGGNSSGGAAGGSKTIKVGVMTSFSGAAASSFAGVDQGVQARLDAYKASGGKCSSTNFQIVKGDDASSAAGALAATQKLEQQDKVYSVIEDSAFFYGAAQWATTAGKKVPVFGGAFDGSPLWNTTTNNLLPASTVPDYAATYTTFGDYLKQAGASTVAGVAYANPASAAGLTAAMRSTATAGIKQGYVNNSLALGSTDVGAIVLGIMRSHADAVYMSINPDAAFAIVAGLHQANYKTKAIITSSGYGADLLESAPAVQAGQGVSFSINWAPSELKNTATANFSAALKQYAGSKSGIPSFTQTMGWLGADLMITGLEKAGCDASQSKLLSTVRADKTWTADGLYPTARDFTTIKLQQQCLYFLKLQGNDFVPQPNAAPLCGKNVS